MTADQDQLDLPTLRVALVGCRKRHLKHTIDIYSSLTHQRGYHIQIVAVYSDNVTSRSRAVKIIAGKSMGPPPKEHDDLSSALTNPDVDIVDLDLASDLLPSAIIAASAAGKVVLSRGAPSVSALQRSEEEKISTSLFRED